MKYSKSVIAAMTHLALHPMMPGDDEISLQMNYPTIDDVPEAFRPLYKAGETGEAVLSRVVGMKTQTDVNNVQGALTNERTAHQTTKTTLSRILGGREADDVLALLDSIPALQSAAQGGGNIDEQVQAKLNQHTAPLQRDLTTANETVAALQQQVAQYQQRESQRVVGDAVSTGAVSTKMLPEAVADVQFMANAIFEVNEHGVVVAKDGIPGVTAGISPEVWLTDLKQKKPFYWPQSVNAGGKGGNGGHNGNNPFTKDNWNMTEQGRILNADPKKAEQLAAQAGTTIGGPIPK